MLDLADEVAQWLQDKHSLDEPLAIVFAAGIFVGLASASRHPEYAANAHEKFTGQYGRRVVGSSSLYEAMAIADGDSRTAAEMLADELVHACPLPT